MTIIVTGHGKFATGLQSSLKLITGLDQVIHTVDFTEEMSADDLAESLLKIKKKSKDETLIFADIPGGTPFNQSVLLKSKYDDVEVIAGTNLPLLIEVVLSSQSISKETINDFIETGQKGILHYSDSSTRSDVSQNEEGI